MLAVKLKLKDNVEEQKTAIISFHVSSTFDDNTSIKTPCVIRKNQKEGFNVKYIKVIDIETFVFYETNDTIPNQQAVIEFSYYEL